MFMISTYFTYYSQEQQLSVLTLPDGSVHIIFIVSYFGYPYRKIMFVVATLCPFFAYFFNGPSRLFCNPFIDRMTSYFTWYLISLWLTVGALLSGKVFFFYCNPLFCVVFYVYRIFKHWRFLMVIIKYSRSVLILCTIQFNNDCPSWRFPMVTCNYYFNVLHFATCSKTLCFVLQCCVILFTYFFKMVIPGSHQFIDCITSYFMWYVISFRLTVATLTWDIVLYLFYRFLLCHAVLYLYHIFLQVALPDSNHITFVISTYFMYNSIKQWALVVVLPDGNVRIIFYCILFWLFVTKSNDFYLNRFGDFL